MSDEQLNKTLVVIEKSLPNWEHAFNQIDPSKDLSMTYSTGQFLETEKYTGTIQTKLIRDVIHRLRQKRTVYDELVLKDCLVNMREIGTALVEEDAKAVPVSFAIHVSDLNKVEIILDIDILAQITRMERCRGTSGS